MINIYNYKSETRHLRKLITLRFIFIRLQYIKFRLPIFNKTVSEANPNYLKASYERNSFFQSSIITNDLRKAISFKNIFNMTNILF